MFDVFFILIDIDECDIGYVDCAINSTCLNTEGSFKCVCNIGFRGDGSSCCKCSSTFSHNMYYLCMLYFIACMDGEVLLYNGSHISHNFTSGTVLLCYNDTYGTVCDDLWDELEARVVCSQLGLNESGMC